jgi:hypothetical protein
LLLIRTMRPDKLPAAVRKFVELSLGDAKWIDLQCVDLAEPYSKADMLAPLLVIHVSAERSLNVH